MKQAPNHKKQSSEKKVESSQESQGSNPSNKIENTESQEGKIIKLLRQNPGGLTLKEISFKTKINDDEIVKLHLSHLNLEPKDDLYKIENNNTKII